MSNAKNASMLDQDYDLTALQEACDEDVLEEMEESKTTCNNNHTPLPSPNPKKLKKRDDREQEKEKEVSNKSIFEAVQTVGYSKSLTSKMSS